MAKNEVQTITVAGGTWAGYTAKYDNSFTTNNNGSYAIDGDVLTIDIKAPANLSADTEVNVTCEVKA